MAIITSTPSISDISVSGKNGNSGTMSWSKPSVPSNATISSCVITGSVSVDMSKSSISSITINGTSISTSGSFSVNIGTDINTTEVTVTATGDKNNAKGTVSFSNLVYTVTYEANVEVLPTGITLSPTNITVQQKQSIIVNAILTPDDSTDEIIWSINDTNIATLTTQASSTQISINGKTVGETTITATAVKSGISISEKVTVEPLMIEAEFEVYLLSVSYGGTAQGGKITDYSSIINVDFSGAGEYLESKPYSVDIIDKTYSLYNIQYYSSLNYSFNTLYSHVDTYNNKYIPEYSFNGEVELREQHALRIYLFQAAFKTYHTVTFVDWNGTILKTETVEEGNAATAPSEPTRAEYIFTGWYPSFNNVTSDLTITAQYQLKTYTVTFKDWDGTVLKTQTLKSGENAKAPTDPTREGYIFIGWDKSFNNVTSDLTVTAQYIDTTDYQIKIAEYKFNNNSSDLIPEFNSEFAYIYEDIVEGDVTTRTIYSNSLPTSISFMSQTSLTEINYLKTDNVISMYAMFYQCSNLTYVNMKDWNTDNLTSLEGIFNSCSKLAIIDGINDINTSQVNNMGGLFSGCASLLEININNWDVGNVTNYGAMFRGCKKITSLDISNWDTSKMELASGMFQGCTSLTSLDLSCLEVDTATTISQMFNGCSELVSLNLSGWTINTDSFTQLLVNCNSLNNIIMKDSDYNSVNKIIAQLPTKTTDSMGTLNITGVDDISQVDTEAAQSKFWNIVEEPEGSNLVAKYTANIAGVVPTFNSGYVYELTETENNGVYTVEITSNSDFSSIDFKSKTGLITVEYLKITNAVTSTYQMFYGCTSLTSINGMSDWDTSNVTTMEGMFRNCTNLTTIDVSNFNTTNVTNMRYMFANCESLTELDLSNFNTSSVINMRNMFSYCDSLTSLNVINFSTTNVTNMCMMFYNCNKLTQLNVSNFNTSNVTDMYSMFYVCQSLTELDVSNFDTSNVTDMDSMFYACQSLTKLDLSNFNTSSVTTMSSMLRNCTNLTSISMNNSDYNSVNKVIAQLPTRTTDSMGTLNIAGVDDINQVDTTTAESKFWNVVEESEEDIIEWTGVGTVAAGLNSGIKHGNYKINLDWDNEYFDIILQNYTYIGNGDAAASVCSVQINNNTYDYYFEEGSIALRQKQGSMIINVYEWTPNVFPNTLRFTKDGIYCLYEEENVKIGEIEYNNDDAIYILEDDQYNTDFSIDFDLVVSERPNEEPKPTYTVTFKDWNGTVLKTETVEEGSAAIAPSNPTRTGYTFTGWDKTFDNVTSDLIVTAQYIKEVVYYTVTFVDWDGFQLKTQTVEEGTSATAPANPTRDGYTFIGWDKDFTNVTSNLTVIAQYEEIIQPPEENFTQINLGEDIVLNIYIGDQSIEKI